MEVKEAVASRLSIRRYAESSIPPEHTEMLIRALQLAPSANNGQNWEFVFVGDAEIKHRLVGLRKVYIPKSLRPPLEP
ncbi:hypothetical protein D1BOALGB6SA_671 [Olavius sp. associated proteobacterium Delta 1]|nr:hypothetical protein D1BOALGB6SA_671 [Olavius sp. associated proteobacterium Delta 1]